MGKKKILFITVPFHAGVVEVAGSWVPLYLVYLAGAARRAGYDAAIYDAMTKNADYPEIEQRIREYNPDFVALSVFTCTSPDGIMVVELAKKINPSIRTILGGVHATCMYEEMFSISPGLDFIVRGEGEQTIVELLDALTCNTGLGDVKGIVYREAGRVPSGQ